MKKRTLFSLVALLLTIFAGSWYFIQNFYDQQVLSQHETYLKQKAELFIRLAEEQNFDQMARVYVADSEERITRLNNQGQIAIPRY